MLLQCVAKPPSLRQRFDKKVPLQPWRDMARHGETIEFIQSLCRWRLADRAEGGAMVAAGC